MEQVTVNLYSFEELTKEAKQTAINNFRNDEDFYSHAWHDAVKEDFEKILETIGFSEINTYFSGFGNQGDGACFEAGYTYAKGCIKAVKDYAPNDTELHEIVKAISVLQKRYGYMLDCEVYTHGRYCHANTMSFNWFKNGNYDLDMGEDETILNNLFKDLANWYYARLEAEYEYLATDEAVEMALESNEYLYTVDGEMY